MPELIAQLDVECLCANLHAVRREIEQAAARAGRDPAEAQLLAAIKYISAEDLIKLAQAGVTLVGENRAQQLQTKYEAHPELFTWHFIGALQSKHVRVVAPRVSLIHSLCTESALVELEHQQQCWHPELAALIQVNVSNDPAKAGIEPHQLDAFIERCPLPVHGLSTMPPFSEDPEHNRRWFARLRELAHARGLHELSMGSSQDFAVAVEEGATIVRIGTHLYA